MSSSAQVAEWPIAVATRSIGGAPGPIPSTGCGSRAAATDPTGKLKAVGWPSTSWPVQRVPVAADDEGRCTVAGGVLPPGAYGRPDFTHCGELGDHRRTALSTSAVPVDTQPLGVARRGRPGPSWRCSRDCRRTLGRVPEILRSDNTSAATHEVKRSRGRGLNDNYAALLDHYCAHPYNRGQSQERRRRAVKDAIDQALKPRFRHFDDYADFPADGRETQSLVQGKLEQEMAYAAASSVPEYVNYQSKVRKWSTIQAAGDLHRAQRRCRSVRRLGGSVLQGPPGGTHGKGTTNVN